MRALLNAARDDADRRQQELEELHRQNEVLNAEKYNLSEQLAAIATQQLALQHDDTNGRYVNRILLSFFLVGRVRREDKVKCATKIQFPKFRLSRMSPYSISCDRTAHGSVSDLNITKILLDFVMFLQRSVFMIHHAQ